MIELIKTSARRIYTRTRIPGIDYVINQYVGCEHACTYCYAKFMCRWKKHGKWGSWIEAKMNAPELVKEIVNGKVAMSSVSDPYQPVEKKLELTRQVLENMDKHTRLDILTKSDLVLRDIDLFKEFKAINVGLTINTFKGREKELFEPNPPSNEARLRALRILKKNNIPTYGFISPVIPGLVDLEPLIAESRGFVDYYIVEMINMNAAGHEFKKLLVEDYPRNHEITANKEKFREFIEEVKKILGKSGTKAPQLITHYPKPIVV